MDITEITKAVTDLVTKAYETGRSRGKLDQKTEMFRAMGYPMAIPIPEPKKPKLKVISPLDEVSKLKLKFFGKKKANRGTRDRVIQIIKKKVSTHNLQTVQTQQIRGWTPKTIETSGVWAATAHLCQQRYLVKMDRGVYRVVSATASNTDQT